MKELAEAVASELRENNVSYAAAGLMTNYSPSAICNYINSKRQMPQDFVRRLADRLNSAKLKVIQSWHCGCGLFKTKYLAGVDDHPAVVKSVGLREMREALEALENLDIDNKRGRGDFTPEEWPRYEWAMEQICDLHPYIEKALESGQKHFGLDIAAVQRRVNRKLDERGYTKEKTAQRAVV